MLAFHHPTTILIAGPTQCGKTFFFKKLLGESLIHPPPSRIIYVYGVESPNLDDGSMYFPNIEYVKGISNFLKIKETIEADENNLVVIDDQMGEAGKLQEVENLFTRGSHHQNITVVYIVQNLFDRGKAHRTISLNSHYLVLFRNPRDKRQIKSLAAQSYPNGENFLVSAYKDATEKQYGYLLLDFHPKTPEPLRVRTNIFRGDEIVIYRNPSDFPAVTNPVSGCGSDGESFRLFGEGYISQ